MLPTFTAISYWLEILASTRFPRWLLSTLIVTNLAAILLFAMIFPFVVKSSPGIAAYFVLYSVTVFLKLISFHHVYHDVRTLCVRVI